MRLLESGIAATSATALLPRERAIVLSLDSVKCIITPKEVVAPDSPQLDDFVKVLVSTLEQVSDGGVAFELVALEAALFAVCASLEARVGAVRADAHAALNALLAKVSSASLEGLKLVKGAMSETAARVAALRDELHRLLDDDSTMRDLYVSRRAETLAGNLAAKAADPSDEDADVQEVEDLLESYFAQIDHAAMMMAALFAHVDRTEDFVNTALDSQRNSLIQVDLLTSFGTFITSLFTLVAGVFGMVRSLY